jgi:VWFA-related protein
MTLVRSWLLEAKMKGKRLAARVSIVLFICGAIAAAQILNQGPRSNRTTPPAAPPTTEESTPTFRSSSRLVVLDVVVSDRDGNAVTGLNQSDFTVLEDGKLQPIQSFETHLPVQQMTEVPDLHLPAGEFTNIPTQPANSAVNVVLLDILNTPTEDQLFARQEMIDFLKTLPRGQPVALFTLGYDLRMIAGFTTSTDDLIAAARKIRPGVSPLLDTEQDQATDDHIFKNIYSGGSPSSAGSASGGNASLANGGGAGGVPLAGGSNSMGPLVASQDPNISSGMAQLMSDFTRETRVVRTDIRVEKTFESLGALARALSGYTGRKNLLWLSEGFPAGVLPQREYFHPDARNYLLTFQQYSGLMEASQISVYPIDIRALKNSTLQPAGGSPELDAPERQHSDLGGSQLMMRDVAEETGGKAFFNTNDLKGALRSSIQHGSTYYTVAYSPQNRNWNGDLRHIQVKLTRPDVKLDYRRGYYAVKDDPGPQDTARRMLIAEMQPGIPQSTMLLLRCKVVPDNSTGKVSIDYGVYAADIGFTGDPLKHATLEFVAVAWDKNEKAAGDVSETMNLDLKPETFQRVMKSGVPAHQELTLKPGTYKLRLGVMDYASAKIGTLEIPVTVAAAQGAPK